MCAFVYLSDGVFVYNSEFRGFVMCKTCLYRNLFYMKMFIPAIVMSIRPTNIDVVLYKQSHATETFSKIDWKDWEGIIFGHILLIIIIS